MSKPHVAILGLGIMGSGMARRLLSANFPLAVYNRNRAKCACFGADGAFVAESPREAASHESKADESNPGVEFIECCYWHVGDVASLLPPAVVSPGGNRPAIIPCTCLAIADRCRFSKVLCVARWMVPVTVRSLTFHDGCPPLPL